MLLPPFINQSHLQHQGKETPICLLEQMKFGKHHCKHCITESKKSDSKKKAMKEAILLYMAKREKVKVHKEVSKIAETVNKTYKTSISGHTVMRHIETGMAGQSPWRCSQAEAFTKMCSNSSWLSLRLLSESKKSMQNQTETKNLLSQCMEKMNNVSSTIGLLQNILCKSSIDIIATGINLLEEQRIRYWPTWRAKDKMDNVQELKDMV